jgi:hypothetical protein
MKIITSNFTGEDTHTNHQLPLFSWFGVGVAFELRRGNIREALRRGWATHYSALSDDEIIERLWCSAELCPIELWDDLELEEIPRPSGSFNYTVRISYAGDDELWRLFPRDINRHPDGEVHKGHVMHEFIADGRLKAERIVAEWLETVEEILDEQRRQIEAFDATLPDFIRVEAHRLRRKHDADLSAKRRWQ